jgi:hypothetical protein
MIRWPINHTCDQPVLATVKVIVRPTFESAVILLTNARMYRELIGTTKYTGS